MNNMYISYHIIFERRCVTVLSVDFRKVHSFIKALKGDLYGNYLFLHVIESRAHRCPDIIGSDRERVDNNFINPPEG